MKPSDALQQGLCPMCLGAGQVESILLSRMIECPLCLGSKKWPPPDDPSWRDG
jgi:hypothetical protein